MSDLEVLNQYLSGKLDHRIVQDTITILINNGFHSDFGGPFEIFDLVHHCIYDITNGCAK